MLHVNRKTISKLLTATALVTAFAFTSVNVMADSQDNATQVHQMKKQHKASKKGAQSKKTLKDCPSCWNG